MSHKPTTMKSLQRTSQQPMVKTAQTIKPETLDRKHAAAHEKRAAVQHIPGPKPSVDK